MSSEQTGQTEMTGRYTESRLDFDLPDVGSEQLCNPRQQAAKERPALLGHQEMQDTSALL